MADKKLHKQLLMKFTPPTGYALDAYYGTAYMKLKKNNKHQLRLVYDYTGGNMKKSSVLEFDKFSTCIRVLSIMEEFAKDGTLQSSDAELEKLLEGE